MGKGFTTEEGELEVVRSEKVSMKLAKMQCLEVANY